MVYKWKQLGYSVPAEVVGRHFESIEATMGEITSRTVLDSARPEESPIHKLFEWDDTKAAEQYRLGQATKLICNLTVEIETDNRPIECRAYMDVSEKKAGSFVNVQSVFENRDSRELVLKRALQELNAFKQKYKTLKELKDIFTDIDRLSKVI